MARIRTIKPEFFTSEDVVALTFPARLLYIAMWCEADRDGRFAWKPRTLKMRYFPADDLDLEMLAKEILDRKLVVLYGDGLAYIPTFAVHQHINPRESASNLLDPHASPRVKHASARVSDVQVGREGREGRIDARVTSQDDETPEDDPAPPPVVLIHLNDGSEHEIFANQVEEWSLTYPNVDVLQALRQMRQWAIANPTKRKTRRGVLAFVNTWLAKEQDKPSKARPSGPASSGEKFL